MARKAGEGGSSRGGRGVPRKAGNKARARRHEFYWIRSSCCGLVFRSPKHKLRHVKSGHVLEAPLRNSLVNESKKGRQEDK